MGLINNIKGAWGRTSQKLHEGITKLLSYEALTDEVLEEFEELLISTDMGVSTAAMLTKALSKEKFPQDADHNDIKDFLRKKITELMLCNTDGVALDTQPDSPMKKATKNDDDASSLSPPPHTSPHVIMLCGVNGSGKTTTAGKLAALYQKLGYKVVVAGCDTFRAAAGEQLHKWIENHAGGCESVIGEFGENPSSILYRATQQAISSGADVIIADTAGRLHNNANLMLELEKSRKVVHKLITKPSLDSLLVIDGTIGQNAHSQIEMFRKYADINGIIVTKLDSSAKGGMIVAIMHKYGIPIKYVGLGEKANDLKQFSVSEFVESLV